MFSLQRQLYKLTVARRDLSYLNKRLVDRNAPFDILEEVSDGLAHGRPVVALESTIVTHGMPFPANLHCALQVSNIIREEGAIPAPIAIINGRIKVGLSEKEYSFLADTTTNPAIKTSRRDFPYVLSKGLNGGTTVAGTIIVAQQVGIPIFVTGGIGGVHRFGESTLDISADLTELSKNNIAVVSSGVKSILDIPKTLEYLETQGVLVATFGDANEFPAFYTRSSGCKSPYQVSTPQQAADLLISSQLLNLQSAMLIAVPVPESDAFDGKLIEQVIQESLKEAQQQNVVGKEVTPFLLNRIAEITEGRSLDTNIALIQNNAKVGAQIAVEYAKRRAETTKRVVVATTQQSSKSPVIIGGCVVDCCAKIREPEIVLDGSTHRSTIMWSGGGVGRNICEAMSKLGLSPKLISVVGDDPNADFLERLMPVNTFKYVTRMKGLSTAQCTVMLDSKGEARLAMGDMDVHQRITPEMIKQHEEVIKKCPLLILDANLNTESIHTAMEIAVANDIPVFYEPTDLRKAHKLFNTPFWKHLTFMSPNLFELRSIASTVGILGKNSSNSKPSVEEAFEICKQLSEYINTIVVTLGSTGVMVVNRQSPEEVFFANGMYVKRSVSNGSSPIRGRFYPTKEVRHLANVNGAGDCWSSGFIVAMLAGLSEQKCVSVGFAAASKSLFSQTPVPCKFFDWNDKCWSELVQFKVL